MERELTAVEAEKEEVRVERDELVGRLEKVIDGVRRW